MSDRDICPPGAAFIKGVGWEKDEDGDPRFIATLVFPNGPPDPDLPGRVVWKKIPARIVLAEEISAND